MEIVNTLCALKLDCLDEDWVNAAYHAEFLEFGEFPSDYESILDSIEIRPIFRTLMKAVDSWLSFTLNAEDEKSWTTLTNQIPHQKLLALLAYLIDNGRKNIMDRDLRNNALLGSRLYYKLLSIPGYKAYNIYHSQLFAHSLLCLSYPKMLCENEDNYFNTKELTREVNLLIRELQKFVYDLRSIIELLQLNPSDMNFEDILSNLVDITGGAIVNKLNVDKLELANVTGVIYEIINFLLCDATGEPDPVAIRLLFKCLLPKLVASSLDCRNANNLVRASYVTYSGLLLTKYGKSALPGYNVMLQHLCYAAEGLEKQEVRAARVSLVVGLMSMLPRKSYRSFVKWLLTLSTTSKIAHRHIAMEMLAKLLCNDPEEPKENTDANLHGQKVYVNTTQQSADNRNILTENQNNQGTTEGSQNKNQENLNEPTITETELSIDKEQDTPQTESLTSNDVQREKNKGISKEPSKVSLDQETEVCCANSILYETESNLNLANNDIPVQQNSESHDQGNGIINENITPDEPLPSIVGELLNFEVPSDEILTSNIDALFSDVNNEVLNITAEDIQNLEELAQSIDINGPNIVDTNNISEELISAQQELDNSKISDTQEKSNENIECDENALVGNSNTYSETVPGVLVQSSQKVSQANIILKHPVVAIPLIERQAAERAEQIAAEEINEQEIAMLLRQRPHTVPYIEILRAFYERINDVSSTLRTKALVLLTECLSNERPSMKEALKELNGDGEVSRLMAAAARCVSDERAAVRRAAVSLVHKLLRQTIYLQHDLAILVALCRDASIIVRSSAISSLGEMVLQEPTDSLIDAFLTGPMHQLSDPENKVQDQVVNLIEQMLIDKLQKLTDIAIEDKTPWMFLAGIIRHNMKSHLQKACTLLAKNSSSISVRLVDILSSHLGSLDAVRDLQCLVFLTSIARHVQYNEIGFVLEYYYKLADSPSRGDVRLAPLCLQMITQWSRWLRIPAAVALRDHLIRSLSSSDYNCRIERAALAAQLNPNDLQWATELMQMSERRALNGGGIEECIRAADLSLVAPIPPSPALLELLLHCVSQPPADWTESDRGCTVVALGRLCIRSRSTAAAATPALATILQTAAPLCAQIAALAALSAICSRYTCIVEPVLDCVSECVRPGREPPLRQAAARALTKLLLGGYLRLRTPLYYSYCALLADEDHDVREPAEYYVTCCLTTDAIYHHFVDCIMHYNHDNVEKLTFDARQLIYDVMLQRLSLVQRLNVQCRLAREVLQHAADLTDEGDGSLSPAINAALLDTITVLCGPRMKLPKKPQSSGDADIDDLQERVTTNIVSHKMKRQVAEVVVPAVLRLHARIGAQGGQTAAYLVKLANDLLNDYKHEIEELIDNDSELVNKVRQFQSTIGAEPSFGNARNLVTSSAPPDPDTPRAPKRKARASNPQSTKRSLRI